VPIQAPGVVEGRDLIPFRRGRPYCPLAQALPRSLFLQVSVALRQGVAPNLALAAPLRRRRSLPSAGSTICDVRAEYLLEVNAEL
jgi:hypothetical protein